DRALGAAGHHHIGIAEGDQSCSIADRVRTRRAGGDDSVVRALQSVADRNIARREVDQASWNEEWTDATRSLLLEQERGFRDAVETADTRADQNTGALLLIGRLCGIARVRECLLGRRHRIDDEVVDLALLLGFHPLV